MNKKFIVGVVSGSMSGTLAGLGVVAGVKKIIRYRKEKKETQKKQEQLEKQSEGWKMLQEAMKGNSEEEQKSVDDILEEVKKEVEDGQKNVGDFIKYAEELVDKTEEKIANDFQERLIEKAINEKDFNMLYTIFEDIYNKYPVQMARYKAFCMAEEDGLITEELVKEAKKYYGKLWNYVGD